MTKMLMLPTFSLALMITWSAAAPPVESPFAATPADSALPAITGQVRIRSEYDQKALRDISANEAYFNTQMRSRLGFTATPSEKIKVKLELQDTRYMGSEPATPAANPAAASTGNAKGVDLLQGYVKLTEGNRSFALGRQKLALGSSRFLSTLEWSPTSRAFDGITVNHDFGAGNMTALAYLVSDSAAKAVKDHLLLSGFFYNHKLTPDHQADLYAFYDQSRLATSFQDLRTQNYDLVYFGERLAGKFGRVNYEEEFIWQAGELSAGKNLTSEAFQLALRVGVESGLHKVNAGLDIMSGDADPTDEIASTYRANYFFGHYYYGWMDYFAANPAYGVMDFRLDGDLGFHPGKTGSPCIKIKPQYHFFLPQAAPSGSDEAYGQEIDLEVHLGLYPKTNLVLGAGLFFAADGVVNLPVSQVAAGQDYRPGYFLYFMPSFNF